MMSKVNDGFSLLIPTSPLLSIVILGVLLVASANSLDAGKYRPFEGAVDPVTFTLAACNWSVAVTSSPETTPVPVIFVASKFTNLWVPELPSSLSQPLFAAFLRSK